MHIKGTAILRAFVYNRRFYFDRFEVSDKIQTIQSSNVGSQASAIGAIFPLVMCYIFSMRKTLPIMLSFIVV